MGNKIEVCSGQESSSFLKEKAWSHTTAETESNKHPQGLRREFTFPQKPTDAELQCDCQPRKAACPC